MDMVEKLLSFLSQIHSRTAGNNLHKFMYTRYLVSYEH